MFTEFRGNSHREAEEFAYNRYRRGQESGSCEQCGWKDGDGPVACFYSDALGFVTHTNTGKSARALMTESQRSLMDSYESMVLVPWDRESEVLKLRADQKQFGRPEAWVDEQLGKPLPGANPPHRYGVEYPADWIFDSWWIPARLTSEEFWPVRRRKTEDEPADSWVCYMVHVYWPHSCGKGRGKHLGPYHIGCTGCKEEVRLWEFGIDPDCG
jgi:hypothetical protein